MRRSRRTSPRSAQLVAWRRFSSATTRRRRSTSAGSTRRAGEVGIEPTRRRGSRPRRPQDELLRARRGAQRRRRRSTGSSCSCRCRISSTRQRIIRAIDPVEGRRRPASVQRRAALPRAGRRSCRRRRSGSWRCSREYDVELERRAGPSSSGAATSSASRWRMLLLQQHATVTICHSRTRDLARETLEADVLVVAVGHPGLVTADMVQGRRGGRRRRDEPDRGGARRRRRSRRRWTSRGT